MNINDKKINELLDRTKNYRNNLSKSMNEFENFNNLNVEELQNVFQEERNKFKIEDNINVFVKCKIAKKELQKGCMKKIKYNRINENGKKETNVIDVKIPSEIQTGQKIIIYGQGNYIKELNKNSCLIIEIK